MKWKLVFALLAAFALPVLLTTAMAQQFGQARTRSEKAPETSVRTSEGAYVISSGAQTFQAVPVPPTPLHGGNTAYTVRFLGGNPEEANLEREAQALGKKLSDVKGSEDRLKIKDQLTEILGKQFDLRQKRHQDEIKELEGKVRKLKDLVDKRQENRKEIIAKRLDQVFSDAEGLGW